MINLETLKCQTKNLEKNHKMAGNKRYGTYLMIELQLFILPLPDSLSSSSFAMSLDFNVINQECMTYKKFIARQREMTM
jgi:hypothetical protein